MTPHLNCKIGDVLRHGDRPGTWVVTGINTISGDVWIEACDGDGLHRMKTITAKTASQWDKTNVTRIK